jgi:hypothetical protein
MRPEIASGLRRQRPVGDTRVGIRPRIDSRLSLARPPLLGFKCCLCKNPHTEPVSKLHPKAEDRPTPYRASSPRLREPRRDRK